MKHKKQAKQIYLDGACNALINQRIGKRNIEMMNKNAEEMFFEARANILSIVEQMKNNPAINKTRRHYEIIFFCAKLKGECERIAYETQYNLSLLSMDDCDSNDE